MRATPGSFPGVVSVVTARTVTTRPSPLEAADQA
jgi:hypothetical protein